MSKASNHRSSNNNSNSNIIAIANRIQDRANQLSNERITLQTLQTKLITIQNNYNIEQQNHDDKRNQYLLQTKLLQEKEMDIYKYKQLIREYEKSIESSLHEIQKLESQMICIQNECQIINSTIYVPHQYDTFMYKHRLEGKVHSLKAKRRKREETLTNMKMETNRNREEVQTMEREIRRIKDEIKMMEDVEVREDEEIAAVAMQIRATLTKVRV